MLPLRAYTFIGLNAIRILSIISLILVFASSIVIMVSDIKAVNHFVEAGSEPVAANSTSTEGLGFNYIEGSTVPNQPAGAFWAVLNRLLIIFQVIVLIMSELGFPQCFFIKYFPILGRDFGTGALGIIQCLVGAAVLSHYVTTFALVSGFFVFVMGCINMFTGLVFRASGKTKRSLTAWKSHAKAALPTHVAGVPVAPIISHAPSFVSSVFGKDEKKAAAQDEEKTGFGFGRQGEKAAALKGFLISKPLESLPRYAPNSRA